MERRERQNLVRKQSFHSGRSSRKSGLKDHDLNSWVRIGLLAKNRRVKFNNLFCHLKMENFRQAFQALDGSKATGIDGIRKKDYGKNLDQNLKKLIDKLHKGSYRPQIKKEVLIPEANGKKRPIAISCFEDKLVEWVLGKTLESVYEPIFIRNSFGFRPKKSTDDAMKAIYQTLKKDKRPHVVEIDLASFFNTVSHRKLMRLLHKRIVDPRMLGLIRRFLDVTIQKETGEFVKDKAGTPQGSIISPVLANIYLHYALDQWFIENYASKEAIIVRYADDAIFMFNKKPKAETFLVALKERLDKFSLALNEDKTGIINFEKQRKNVFHFLGFTLFWGKLKGWQTSALKLKTRKDTLRKKINEFYDWIKLTRNRITLKEIWETTKAKLRGHYNYYGFICNKEKLNHFYYAVTQALFKWLNRRSQRKSFTWDKFGRRLKQNPLPKPPTMTKLKQLDWNPYVR